MEDITDRKQAEKALQESEQRFRTVLENLSGGISAHDLEGRLMFVNEAACRNTGYSREGLLQMQVAEIDPAAAERADHLFWQSLEIGQSIFLESTHIRKDGSAYDAEIHLNKINLEGKPAILPIVFDISDRKQAEKKQEKLLAQLNQVMTNLAINARDAIAETGILTIEIDNIVVDKENSPIFSDIVPGKYVLLTVNDTGRGMDKKNPGQPFRALFYHQGGGREHRSGLAHGLWHCQAKQQLYKGLQ